MPTKYMVGLDEVGQENSAQTKSVQCAGATKYGLISRLRPGSNCCWYQQDAVTEEHDGPLLRQSAGQGIMRTVNNKTPAQLCSDYWHCLYQHLITKLEEQIGSITLLETPIHFILATPAGWEDNARERIKRAAEEAGFGSRSKDRMTLVAEPEAAALAAFDGRQKIFEVGNGPFKEQSTKANRRTWLKGYLVVSEKSGEKGTVDILTCDEENLPARADDPSLRLLGELKLDFTTISSPRKRLRSTYSWTPSKRSHMQKVQIGQIIHPEKNTVEFIGRVGKRQVGLKDFRYNENMEANVTELEAEDDECEEDGNENSGDESEDVDSGDDEDALPSYEDIF
ncbi:hypothetical protein VTN00DRAFT_7050 [Thermoascus crustaceus]|uniref:uncharacterized protein n=1 Tax=Thermoascus crustaceus TaxID=5088 RepID=UPI0037436FFD